MSLADLTLFPATREQAIESRKRSYEQWGRPNDVPEEWYLDRQNIYNGLEMVADGRWTTWVLAPRDNPEGLDFVCSCETLRREAIVFNKSSSQPESRTGYGIASVFTPPQNRGKGYAGHMMRLLHWVLAPAPSLGSFPKEWGAPPTVPEGFGTGIVSVLYSDVGDKFYKNCGPVPGTDGWTYALNVWTNWNVKALVEQASTAGSDGKNWALLGVDELKAVIDRDSELIIETTPTLQVLSKNGFTFLPRKGLAEYQRRKADWFIGEKYPTFKHWGIQRTSEESDCPMALWTVEIGRTSPSTLLITRLRCPREVLPELIGEIAKFANGFGLEKIQVWNMSEDLREEAARFGGASADAHEHLSCMKWYGEGEGVVEWLNNEKFPWC